MSSSKRRRGGHRSSDSSSSNPSSFNPNLSSEHERKTRQLCRQVQQRLDMVLGGELDDPVLDGLWVVDVEPEPGGSTLLVTVVAPDTAPLEPIRAGLEAARGHLRSEISSAINRKRTPHLRFAVIPERALRAGQEGA